jgi:hypothetical protein
MGLVYDQEAVSYEKGLYEPANSIRVNNGYGVTPGLYPLSTGR